jgi:hypothetical protein
MNLDLEVNEVEVKGLTSLASVTEITGDRVKNVSKNYTIQFSSPIVPLQQPPHPVQG